MDGFFVSVLLKNCIFLNPAKNAQLSVIAAGVQADMNCYPQKK